jgi:zinc protease
MIHPRSRFATAVRARATAVVAVLLLLATSPAPARAADAAPPLAHREVLPNGIVLLVAERPAVPIVIVRVFSRAGAAFDPPDRAGLANLTAALVTRGTAKHSGRDLDAAIEFVGGSLEAGAGRDGLACSLSVLVRDLPLGLDLLREVVREPTFPEAELRRKVQQISAAIQRSEENPGAVAERALARAVFPNHPYGTPVEGTRASLARITRDDVVAFHRRHVRPETTTIVVVGAVTVAQARDAILARFGDWTGPTGAAEAVPRATPQPPHAKTIVRDLTQSTILLGRQAVDQSHPDYFPLTVAAYVLGGGSASRLYLRVREEGGLAYSVYAFLSPGRYGSSVTVGAQTRTAEVGRVVDLLRAEMTRLGREPVSAAELGLAKDYLIGSFPFRLETSRKTADFLVAVEHMGLGLDYAARYRERIAAVTAADVQRVAATYFAPDGFSRVIVGAAR